MFYSFDGQDRSVYNLIRRCVDEGNWAVIQNIHLYPELVDQIVDQLRQDQKDFGNEFRLWMIGYASSQYSPMALQFCKWFINHVRQHFRNLMYCLNYELFALQV